MHRLRSSFSHEDATTAVEYGIMVALVVVVIVAALFAFRQTLGTPLADVDDCLAGASAEVCPAEGE